jgi:Sec-independent protein translocase protein TatA
MLDIDLTMVFIVLVVIILLLGPDHVGKVVKNLGNLIRDAFRKE